MVRIILFLISFFLLVSNASAQVLENYNGKNEVTERNSWMITETQLNYQINLNTYPLANFYLEVPEECTVFLDGKLWFIAERDTTVLTPIAQVAEEFGSKEVKLTLVGRDLDSDNVSVQKILSVPSIVPVEISEEGQLPLVPRNNNFQGFIDFYFVSLFLILFLLALYRVGYPFLFSVMLSPLSVINAEDFSESGSLRKFFSFDIQMYLFIVSMMLAQVVLTVGIIFKPLQLSEWVNMDFVSLLSAWIGFSIFFLFLTLVKFITIRIVSYLFDLGKTDFAHFFYLLRMIVFSVAMVSLATAVLMVNNFGSLEANFSWFLTGMFWVYLLAILGLFLIMVSRLSFKKYHLFTYLCIAELVPFLIFSKWIWVLIN